MKQPVEWSGAAIVESIVDGDEHGWPTELAWLWANHAEQMVALIADVAANGFREPIQVHREGDRYRMWDGHHRVAVGLALGIAVPVEFV